MIVVAVGLELLMKTSDRSVDILVARISPVVTVLLLRCRGALGLGCGGGIPQLEGLGVPGCIAMGRSVGAVAAEVRIRSQILVGLSFSRPQTFVSVPTLFGLIMLLVAVTLMSSVLTV